MVKEVTSASPTSTAVEVNSGVPPVTADTASPILGATTAASSSSARNPAVEGGMPPPTALGNYALSVVAVRERFRKGGTSGSSGGLPIQGPDSGPSSPRPPRAGTPEHWKSLQSDVGTLARHFKAVIRRTRTGETPDPSHRSILQRLDKLWFELGGFASAVSAPVPGHEPEQLKRREAVLTQKTLLVASEIAAAAEHVPPAEQTRLLPLCGKVILRALAIAGIALTVPFAMAVAGVVGFAAGMVTTPLCMIVDHRKREKMFAEAKEKMRAAGKAAEEIEKITVADLESSLGLPPALDWWLCLPVASNTFGMGHAWHVVWAPLGGWLESHKDSIQESLDARQRPELQAHAKLELQAKAEAVRSKLQAQLREANPGQPVDVTLQALPAPQTTTVTDEMLEGPVEVTTI